MNCTLESLQMFLGMFVCVTWYSGWLVSCGSYNRICSVIKKEVKPIDYIILLFKWPYFMSKKKGKPEKDDE